MRRLGSLTAIIKCCVLDIYHLARAHDLLSGVGQCCRQDQVMTDDDMDKVRVLNSFYLQYVLDRDTLKMSSRDL